MPVDQHALIALAAPRAVYIESATDSPSSDQKGQFLGHVGAMPAYALYGLRSTGLVEGDWPPATDTAYHGRAMGYHLRRGGHNLLKADWRLFMDFADLNLSASPRTVVVEASDPPAAKSTDPHAMLRWSTASNGTLGNLQANAAGDYVTYAIPDLRAGVTYDVAVRARKTSDAGIFKIYVQDELSGAGSQRGAASGYDRYTSSAFLANLSRFAYTPLTSGTHYMQFRVSGRNPANLTGFYRVSIDHITLTPR